MKINVSGLLLAVLLLILCVVVFFYPFFLSGKVLSANDVAYLQLPFSLDAPAGFQHPYNYLLADQVQEFYVLRNFLKTSVLRGFWPRWMPNVLCGKSFVSDIQAQAYYPPHILCLFLPIPVSETLENCLEILLAGIGVLLFLGRFQIRPARALLGSLAYMFCSYNIVWLNHVHASVSVYLPLFLWSLELILSGGALPRRGIIACALATYFLITGSHPNTIVLFFFLAALYVVFRTAVNPRELGVPPVNWRQWGYLGLGVGLGVALAAIIVFPFIAAKLSEQFYYGNRPGVAQQCMPLPLKGLIPLILPHAFGSPVTLNDHNIYNFNENGMFVGVTTLLIALMSLPWAIRRPLYVFFLAISLLTILTLLDIQPVSFIVRHIPVLQDNHIQRMTVLSQFAMAICGAIGWDTLCRRERTTTRGQRIWLLFCTIAVVAVVLITVFLRARIPGYGFFLMACAVAGPAIIVVADKPRFSGLASWVVLPVLFVELAAAHASYNPFLPLNEALLKEPAIAREMKEDSRHRWFRMAALDGTYIPNLAALSGLNDIRGYDVPIFKRYIDFLRIAFYRGRWDYELNYWHCGSRFMDEGNLPLVNLMGVRFVLWGQDNKVMKIENPNAFPHGFWATNCVPSSGSMETDIEAIRTQGSMVAETRRVDQCRDNGSGAISELPSPDSNHVRFEMTADTPGIFALNETPISGWKARIDGSPSDVFPVNVIQLGVYVEPGRHVVEFNFLPASFIWGGIVSLGAATVLLLLTLGPFITRRRMSRRV